MNNKITPLQSITYKCESLSFEKYKEYISNLDKETLKQLAERLSSIKDFYEKNLIIYPEFTKDGSENFIHSMSSRKLSMIKKKGKYLIETLQNK